MGCVQVKEPEGAAKEGAGPAAVIHVRSKGGPQSAPPHRANGKAAARTPRRGGTGTGATLNAKLTVLGAVRESEDGRFVSLRVRWEGKTPLPALSPGQHVAIVMNPLVGGSSERFFRKYTLRHDDLGEDPRILCFTVKRLNGGRASTPLCGMVGLDVAAPDGSLGSELYKAERRAPFVAGAGPVQGQVTWAKLARGGPSGTGVPQKKYLFLAGGAGVTLPLALLSHMRTCALGEEVLPVGEKTTFPTELLDTEVSVVLLYSERDPEGFAFMDFFSDLQAAGFATGGTFRVHLFLTSMAGMTTGWEPPHLSDRITLPHIQQLVPDFLERQAVLCGPASFMQDLKEGLSAAGVDRSGIVSEEFTS